MASSPSGPARAGALIYAKDPEKLVGFYQEVLTMAPGHTTEEITVLSNADTQLIIHALPAAVAERLEITTPPTCRLQSAIKLFFTVGDLDHVVETVRGLGGSALPGLWSNPRFRVINAVDPEGNVFHLREWTTAGEPTPPSG